MARDVLRGEKKSPHTAKVCGLVLSAVRDDVLIHLGNCDDFYEIIKDQYIARYSSSSHWETLVRKASHSLIFASINFSKI